MKHRILTAIAVLMSLCLFVELSQPALQNTRLAWVNLDWLTGSDNFYFKKRQWLADVRTVLAAIGFLCKSGRYVEVHRVDAVTLMSPPPSQTGTGTNMSGIEHSAG
jgi:hypothetical protein